MKLVYVLDEQLTATMSVGNVDNFDLVDGSYETDDEAEIETLLASGLFRTDEVELDEPPAAEEVPSDDPEPEE